MPLSSKEIIELLTQIGSNELDHLLPDNTIFVGFRGSIAHGMWVPNFDENSIDDKDIIGVYMNPPPYYIGLETGKETIEKKQDEWDCVFYEYRHFIRLLYKNNPNILTTLWLDPKYVIKSSKIYETLVSNRTIFSSKLASSSFVGYAYTMLQGIEKKQQFNGYMGSKRKQLVDKFGYDCKNAAHLIRLLRMGIQFLTDGTLQVERCNDANELLDIKHGQWSLDRVNDLAYNLFQTIKDLKQTSQLPEVPDYQQINKLCMDVIMEYLHGQIGSNSLDK